MLIFRLFGGSLSQGVPGQGDNMFDFHGPRGLKVGRGGGWLARWRVCTRVGCCEGERRTSDCVQQQPRS